MHNFTDVSVIFASVSCCVLKTYGCFPFPADDRKMIKGCFPFPCVPGFVKLITQV